MRQEIKTLQEWLDVGIQRYAKDEETGEIKAEKVREIMNKWEFIDVEAINKEREKLGITEKLEGGKLDLRGYKNLRMLVVPAESLKTPLTSVDISDCPRLGEINY